MNRLVITLMIILSIAPICGAQNLSPLPNKKGLWGYVNEKGKYTIKPVYQNAEPFFSDLARVKVNGLYGYINRNGQFVIPAIYDDAETFDGRLSKCSLNGKYGLLTTSGAEFLDFDFDDLKKSKNKMFYLGKKNGDDKTYVISIQSDTAVVNSFDYVSDTYENGAAYVKDSGLFGYIDNEGNVILSPVYLELPQYNEKGIAITHKNSGYGLTNSSFKQILPEKFTFVTAKEDGNYNYGYHPDAYGIISSSGTIVLEEGTYTNMTTIDANLIRATDSQGKHAVINNNGDVILQSCDNLSIAEYIATYTNGKESGKINLINGKRAISVKGKEIWSTGQASRISYEAPLILWVDSNGKTHRMTETGSPVFEEYSEVEMLAKGVYSVKRDSQCAIASSSGSLLSEWVDGIIPILDDYVQLIKSGGYGRTYCAIYRITTKKMITGYDFAWIYTPKTNGMIPVKLLRGDNLSQTDKSLKMNGDSFYIVGDLSEGFYPITDFNTKKMGVMTENGKILVSPKYDEVDHFQNGMCRVWIAEKGNGFINTSGSLVVPCKYPYVIDFGSIEGVKNYTQVWDNWGQTYYIDKKGNVADPDKVMREAYDSQRQSSWY